MLKQFKRYLELREAYKNLLFDNQRLMADNKRLRAENASLRIINVLEKDRETKLP